MGRLENNAISISVKSKIYRASDMYDYIDWSEYQRFTIPFFEVKKVDLCIGMAFS